jgi:hypothetical protein
MPKRKVKKEKDKDTLFLILLVPVTLLMIIVGYTLLAKLSEGNRRFCGFLGRVWLEGVPGDLSVRSGCYTWKEIYD